ncbi:MAG: right-handed parallel beta-helix repeat-containing protein, partial [Ignavibacteriaceae bacterium]
MDNYVLGFDGSSNITFRNLTFRSSTLEAGRLIDFSGKNREITLEGNNFQGVGTSSSDTKYALIYSKDAEIDNLEIRNNYLYDGSYGLLFSDSVSNIRLFNNECKRQSYTSFRLQQVAGLEIINNRIDNRPALNASWSYAIWIDTCWQTLKITENRILLAGLNNGLGAKGGIFLRGFIGSTERGLVANNFIRMWIQPGVVAGASGIQVLPTVFEGCDFYNNTIWITGGPTQVCYPLYVATSTASSEMHIKNNILINETDGLAMFSYNAQSTSQSDYNDLFSNGSNLVAWNAQYYPDLASYQSATGQDLHSISANPLFVADDDLHIKSGSPVDGKGTPLAEVPRDIDNQLRSLTVPDIGADEYTAQRIIIKRKNKLNKILLPLTITRDSLHIDPTDDPMISGYVLSDVNVFIDTLVHTNLADLEISLTHKGVIDTLAKFLPDSASGFIGTILDDSGLLALNEGVSPYTGSYRPHSPLSVFNGVDPEGEWVLEIYDRSSGNFGILDAWGIELVFEQTTGVPDE